MVENYTNNRVTIHYTGFFTPLHSVKTSEFSRWRLAALVANGRAELTLHRPVGSKTIDTIINQITNKKLA